MLKWYEVTASTDDALRNVLKSLRKQRLMARKQDGQLYACISNHHQVWLSRVCQDFSAQLKVLEQAPVGIREPLKEEYEAPCGEKFYDPVLYSHHFRTCEKCRATERPAKVPRRKAKGVEAIAKLEPGMPLTLDGVISSIEVVRDQLWERVESLDSLLGNLKGYRDAKAKLSELSTEADKRIEAVRLLLRDGKL